MILAGFYTEVEPKVRQKLWPSYLLYTAGEGNGGNGGNRVLENGWVKLNKPCRVEDSFHRDA